jgi:general secretion pathway protein I
MNSAAAARRCAGFSLLEVVVAFAILALALGALYQVFSSAGRRASLAQDYGRAVALADAKLAEPGITATLAPGSQSGESANRFRWQRSVEAALAPAEPAQNAPLLYRITVEVRWTSDGAERAVTLTTLRLGFAT